MYSEIQQYFLLGREYLEKMNMTADNGQSINWITHQKCNDMFILSKVSQIRKHIIFKKKLHIGESWSPK